MPASCAEIHDLAKHWAIVQKAAREQFRSSCKSRQADLVWDTPSTRECNNWSQLVTDINGRSWRIHAPAEPPILLFRHFMHTSCEQG